MSTEVSVLSTPSGIMQRDYTQRDVIDTIRRTVAKDANDAELTMFLELAKVYQLDPFLKEIWCVKMGGGMTVMTSRDGYMKAAMRDPNYDGIASAAVAEGDRFVMDPMNSKVEHEFGAKRGPIIGAYAVVFHKKRRPVISYAPMAEYKGNSPVWQKYPSAMIIKVAEVFALKRQFGINGLVTREEMDYTMPEEAPAPSAASDVPAEPTETREQVAARRIAEETKKKLKARTEGMERALSKLGKERVFQIVGSEGASSLDEAIADDAIYRRVAATIKSEMDALV